MTAHYAREDDPMPLVASPDPTPNVPLLRKAVEFVEASYTQQLERGRAWQNAQRESGSGLDVVPNTGLHWNQRDWSTLLRDELPKTEVSGTVSLEDCGTAYCVAGYVVSIQPEYAAHVQPVSDEYQDPGRPDRVEMELVETWNGLPILEDDFLINHASLAQELLGLTQLQAAQLFMGSNSPHLVRELAERYAGEKL